MSFLHSDQVPTNDVLPSVAAVSSPVGVQALTPTETPGRSEVDSLENRPFSPSIHDAPVDLHSRARDEASPPLPQASPEVMSLAAPSQGAVSEIAALSAEATLAIRNEIVSGLLKMLGVSPPLPQAEKQQPLLLNVHAQDFAPARFKDGPDIGSESDIIVGAVRRTPEGVITRGQQRGAAQPPAVSSRIEPILTPIRPMQAPTAAATEATVAFVPEPVIENEPQAPPAAPAPAPVLTYSEREMIARSFMEERRTNEAYLRRHSRVTSDGQPGRAFDPDEVFESIRSTEVRRISPRATRQRIQSAGAGAPDDEDDEQEDNDSHSSASIPRSRVSRSPTNDGYSDEEERPGLTELAFLQPLTQENVIAPEIQIQPRNVIAMEQAKFSLREITVKSISDFYTACVNALTIEPTFNPANRIEDDIKKLIVSKRNKILLEATKDSSGIPTFGTIEQMTLESLFTLGRTGRRGLLEITAILKEILTPKKEAIMSDTLDAFKKYRLLGPSLQDVKRFIENLSSNFRTYFGVLKIACPDALAKEIIKDRERSLAAMQHQFHDQKWWSHYLATKMHHATLPRQPLSNPLSIFIEMLTWSLEDWERTFERDSASKPQYAAQRTSPVQDRDRNRAARAPYQRPQADLRQPPAGNPRPQQQKVKFDTPAPSNEKSNELICFNCGMKGVKSDHPGCANVGNPNAKGNAAYEAYKARRNALSKTRHPSAMSAMTPAPAPAPISKPRAPRAPSRSYSDAVTSQPRDKSPAGEKTWTWSMATIIRHKNGALDLDALDPTPDSDSEEERASDNDDVPDLIPGGMENCSPDRFASQKRKPKHPPITPLPFEKRTSTANFISPLTINGRKTTGLWDTAAMNGNWILASEARKLKATIEKGTTKTFASPLFPGTTFQSKDVVFLDIEFKLFGFSILQVECRILPDDEGPSQAAPIIFGQDLINLYGILNYIVLPATYKRIEAPVPAPEEMLENVDGCIIPFSTAILNMSGMPIPDITMVNATSYVPYDYDTAIHVCNKFPRALRKRALEILKYYDGIVYVDKLDNSTIDYPPMLAKLTSPFEGVPPRRMNRDKEIFLEKWLLDTLKRGIIRPSNATKTSPLLLVPKDDPITPYRITEDVSVLNSHLEPMQAQIPVTRELITKIAGHKFYVKNDMVDCFFQFKVDPKTSALYAFSTHKGNYEFCDVLPQGEKNAPAWCVNAMNHMFAPTPFVCTYFDDQAFGNNDPSALLDQLEEYLAICLKYNIKLSRKKVRIGHDTLEALGFVINEAGYSPKLSHVQKFLTAPFPVRDQLRSWFGLLNVFRDFLPDMSKVEAAFTAVRKKNAPWLITSAMRQAFDYAQEQVACIKMLTFPDESKQLYVDTDASQVGCGAMLYQYDDTGKIKMPIRFMSHVFTAAALKWSTIEKECYALVRAFNCFENFLMGRTFVVRTDHRNLLWMQNSINQKVSRWFSYLYSFEFTLEHIPGIDNVVADALSRIFATMPAPRPTELIASSQPDPSPDPNPLMLCQITPVQEWSLEKTKALFSAMHGPLEGHPGVARSIRDLKHAGCNLPHLKQQVIRWVAACATCTKARALRTKRPQALERHTVNSFEAFEAMQADFLTGLPPSVTGMTCILSFVCTFTRFTMLVACPDQSAQSACNALLHVWGLFSAPHVLTTDGGSGFVSEQFQSLCDMLRISHRVTLPHHPQAHGIVERQHREILDTAKKVFMDINDATADNWPNHLPLVQRVLNTRTHSATGFAPHHMVFGSEATTRLDALNSNLADVALVLEKPTPTYVREIDASLRLITAQGLQSVEDKILQNYLKSPEQPRKFAIGDFVFITNTRPITMKLGKFAPNYAGPLLVVEDFNSDTYQVRDVTQDKANFYVHACDMIKSSITSVDEAREIASRDYKEFFLKSVISHYADPTNPDALGKLTFDVTFTDEPDTVLTVPYADVKFVKIIQDYLLAHKLELPAAYKQSHSETENIGRRARVQSQFLAGHDLR